MSHAGNTRAAKASKVHGMGRGQRYASLIAIVAILGTTAFVLAGRIGHHRPLSTTPVCLQKKSSFCTGIALAGLQRTELAGFTKATGVFPAIIEYYQRFGASFSTDNARLVAQVHARPFIQINPHGVSMADIAAGKYDSWIKSYALAIKKYGHPVMLSFGHEFNGNWSTWSLPFTSPQDFVAAWRHIHEVFAQEKVKDVVWTWDFSAGFTHVLGGHSRVRNPGPWWPGTAYVDWIGIDGYLFGQTSFPHKFVVSIQVARKISKSKPIFIAETAVEPGPSQVAGIQQLFAGARKYQLKGLIWFDVNKRAAWRLEGNRVAAATFRQAVQGSK
jgi:Glycosyl hydrolase family 26